MAHEKFKHRKVIVLTSNVDRPIPSHGLHVLGARCEEHRHDLDVAASSRHVQRYYSTPGRIVHLGARCEEPRHDLDNVPASRHKLHF